MTETIDEAKGLPRQLQDELRDFLLALAETKRALGLRYAEWCDRAPRLEAGVAASAMAQDQLGQARVLYALIQQFPDAPLDLDDETRPHTFNLAYLDQPLPNWATFTAVNLLVGSGVTVTEEALVGSRFSPLRSRMPKMLEEERFHWLHAEGWFRQLQAMDGHLSLELAQALEQILPQVLCWFGDAQHARLANEMIMTADPGQLRELYLERVGPLLRLSAARDLVEFHESSRYWSYTRALPWNQFDPTTRRVSPEIAAPVSDPSVRCPFCHGSSVQLFSLFGSQLLTTEYYCRDCRTVFEQVKR